MEENKNGFDHPNLSEPDQLSTFTRKRWKAITIGLTCVVGWAFCFLTMNIFQEYSVGLFFWLPLVMGFMNALMYGSRFFFERNEAFHITGITLLVFYSGLLLFAMEGLICMIMAAPIGFIFFALGHVIARAFMKHRKEQQNIVQILVPLIISIPLFMAFDTLHKAERVRSVTTAIEIDASPETVWNSVISFPQLQAPTEFIFKTGIAYPINATISGSGVNAVRHCNFSTGSFVEPITIWNKPNLLRFSVDDQPEPMKEISPYNIHPNHLHGYWVSKQGQFRLKRLPNGHTLLEGTTWYINKIEPGFYWTLWSDYIVHSIHKRVLAHIKKQAEKA